MNKQIEHKIINGAEYKHCSKCGEWKVLSEFSKDKRSWDGLQCKCKECKAKYCQAHREKIAEYYNQYNAQRYATLEGYAYCIRRDNLKADRKQGRCAKNEDPLPPLEYYIWALQQRDFYDGKQYHWSEMGLDRIYNDKPHTFANVVPCSSANNKRRHRKSFEEFCEMMRREGISSVLDSVSRY